MPSLHRGSLRLFVSPMVSVCVGGVQTASVRPPGPGFRSIPAVWGPDSAASTIRSESDLSRNKISSQRISGITDCELDARVFLALFRIWIALVSQGRVLVQSRDSNSQHSIGDWIEDC